MNNKNFNKMHGVERVTFVMGILSTYVWILHYEINDKTSYSLLLACQLSYLFLIILLMSSHLENINRLVWFNRILWLFLIAMGGGLFSWSFHLLFTKLLILIL